MGGCPPHPFDWPISLWKLQKAGPATTDKSHSSEPSLSTKHRRSSIRFLFFIKGEGELVIFVTLLVGCNKFPTMTTPFCRRMVFDTPQPPLAPVPPTVRISPRLRTFEPRPPASLTKDQQDHVLQSLGVGSREALSILGYDFYDTAQSGSVSRPKSPYLSPHVARPSSAYGKRSLLCTRLSPVPSFLSPLPITLLLCLCLLASILHYLLCGLS